MAQPKLKADFFVAPDGTCVLRADPLTPADRRAVFERDGGKCRLCGVQTSLSGARSAWDTHRPVSCQADHIFPRARGGQNNPENIQLLCQPCNSQKGNKTMAELAVYRERISKFWWNRKHDAA